MKELIEGLGLPATVAFLIWSAYGGVLFYRSLRREKNGQVAGDTMLNAERRTNNAVERVLDRIEDAHKETMENIDRTRHELRNAIHEHVFGRHRRDNP